MRKRSLNIALFLTTFFAPHLFSANLLVEYDEQKEGSYSTQKGNQVQQPKQVYDYTILHHKNVNHTLEDIEEVEDDLESDIFTVNAKLITTNNQSPPLLLGAVLQHKQTKKHYQYLITSTGLLSKSTQPNAVKRAHKKRFHLIKATRGHVSLQLLEWLQISKHYIVIALHTNRPVCRNCYLIANSLWKKELKTNEKGCIEAQFPVLDKMPNLAQQYINTHLNLSLVQNLVVPMMGYVSKEEMQKAIQQKNKQLKEKDIKYQEELKKKEKQIITLKAQEKQSSNELNNKNERIETLSNQLKDKNKKLNDKSQQLNEKNEQLNELKSTLKETSVKHQEELKKKEKQIITLKAQEKQSSNELNNKNERIETLSNQLKDKNKKLNDKSQQLNEKNEQLNELKSTLKETSVKHQEELKKKDQEIQSQASILELLNEQINMLNQEVNKKDEQLNDKNNTISTLNNQLKENQQKIAALQSILQNIPKQPLDDNKKKELFKAIENNNIKKVKLFLDTYKDVVNARDEDNDKKTPFLCAANKGQLKIAKLLRQRGADINAKSKSGNNALHLACYFSGSVDMVTWLLDVCHIDLELKGYAQKTPFLYAAEKRQLAIAKLLRQREANINAKNKDGNNALHWACLYSGSVPMVTWLLDVCKIGIESKGQYQKTPFLYAAQKGQLKIAKLLRQQGANINAKDKDGDNALHFACYFSGSEAMVTWLLDVCKIDIETKGFNQMTPFLCAAEKGDLAIAKLLRQRGANINAKSNHENNALHRACLYSSSEEIVTWLLDVCHIDIESKGYQQQTPFLSAAEKGQLAIAKLLRQRGANINAKDKNGNNALHRACLFSGSEAMVTWLLDVCKIDIESKGNYQKTPFLCAANKGQLAIAKLLRQRGANIHAKDKNGDNSLYYAKQYSNSEAMINYLKELGLR